MRKRVSLANHMVRFHQETEKTARGLPVSLEVNCDPIPSHPRTSSQPSDKLQCRGLGRPDADIVGEVAEYVAHEPEEGGYSHVEDVVGRSIGPEMFFCSV